MIRVTATGAPVQAALQTSITRTLAAGRRRPGRRDRRRPSPLQIDPRRHGHAEPGRRRRIAMRATVVRMLSPAADTTATITATAVGAAQPVPRADDRAARGRASRPRSSSAASPSGQYTVEVDGGARPLSPRCGRRPASARDADFAWYTAAPPVDRAEPVRDAARPAARAHAREPDRRGGQRVTVDAVDGSFSTRGDGAAGGSASVRLASRHRVPAGCRRERHPRGRSSLTGDGALAGFPVWPSDAAAQQITVYP